MVLVAQRVATPPVTFSSRPLCYRLPLRGGVTSGGRRCVAGGTGRCLGGSSCAARGFVRVARARAVPRWVPAPPRHLADWHMRRQAAARRVAAGPCVSQPVPERPAPSSAAHPLAAPYHPRASTRRGTKPRGSVLRLANRPIATAPHGTTRCPDWVVSDRRRSR